jgi:tetratricopeptide (TPR) repeat protein
MIKTKFFLLIASLAFVSQSLQAQNNALKTPAPSPMQTLKQAFALSDITIEYSRPSAKGRVVYGELVPFGKMWRTGANAATKITFGEEVKVEGKAVPAGTYALYSIPNKDSWEITLYKDLSIAGRTNEYKIENELTRFTVKSSTLSSKVETFTINVCDITATTAVIELVWEKTRVAFNVVADIDGKVMKNIETSLATDTRPYFQAANYYYENDKDQKQALDWVNKAIEQNPKGFWIVMLKARIQLKLKDNTAAISSAEQVIALAKEAQNDDYIKMAEKLIADAKKK